MGFFSSIAKGLGVVSDIVGSPLGGLATDIGSGLFAQKGVQDANAANISNAREAAAFNANQALLNRQFQERSQATAMRFNAHEARKSRSFSRVMSNTAHQRQVNDLRRAGLNPILSAKYGGSSTPSSTSASVSPTSGSTASRTAAISRDTAGPMIEASLNTARTRAEIARIDAQTSLVGEQKLTEKAKQSDLYSSSNQRGASTQQMAAMVEKIGEELNSLRQNQKLTKAQQAKVRQETALIELKINEALAESKIYAGEAGEIIKTIEKMGQVGWTGPLMMGLKKFLPKATFAAIFGAMN